jgi:GTPase SAR1 family protein
VGRDVVLEDAEIALHRLRNGLAAKSLLMVGLRGVGKTVLLNQMLLDADGRGYECVWVEAPEDRSLPATLAGPLNSALIRLSRSFAFPEIGPLTGKAARRALEAPAGRLGVTYSGEAMDDILRITEGYPYFLQEWGSACWMLADGPVVTRRDVDAASPVAINELDTTFFRVRFERTTPFERRYLRAMADLGPGPHRSGEVAQALGRKVQSVAPTRSTLIRKGMIYSLAHGDTAFTVPLFDQYLKRVMPEWS